LRGINWTSNTRGNWVCLDWDSGKVMYEAKWNGNKGSIIYADDMLYCYDENTDDVALVKLHRRILTRRTEFFGDRTKK
jgi:outer membrane protein assembly factor BamB